MVLFQNNALHGIKVYVFIWKIYTGIIQERLTVIHSDSLMWNQRQHFKEMWPVGKSLWSTCNRSTLFLLDISRVAFFFLRKDGLTNRTPVPCV